MTQVLFVVWRESVEALLVIGILFAWIRGRSDSHRWLGYLWGGVAAGLAGAGVLGTAILFAGEAMSDEAQTLFQTGLMLVACALIVQMVMWMRRHGRMLKQELQDALEQRADNARGWGVAILAAIAVAREGSETVVFLYGTGQSLAPADFLLGAAAGGLLAAATFMALQMGGRIVSWRAFFRVTEVLLLLLGAGMLMNAIDQLLSLEILPTLVDPVWDTSALLDDGTAGGSLVASFTGYRAMPSLTGLLCYVAYWAIVWVLSQRAHRPAPVRRAVA